MYQGSERLPVEDGEAGRRRRRPVIRSAHSAEGERVTATVVAGCSGMPLCEWLAPNPGFRRGVLTGYFRIPVTHVLTHGYVEVIDGDHLPLAVAGWLPSSAPPAPPGYARQVARATAPWDDRFRALDDDLARVRAHGHRRLVFLAVLTTSQGRGLGTALLDHHLGSLPGTASPRTAHRSPSPAALNVC